MEAGEQIDNKKLLEIAKEEAKALKEEEEADKKEKVKYFSSLPKY